MGQALDVDPATGELEGDEEGFPEEYPLELLNIATADFMAKACVNMVEHVGFYSNAMHGVAGSCSSFYFYFVTF